MHLLRDSTHLLRGLNKDYYGGALMALVGLSTAYAGDSYRMGTLSDMGPGYFPTAIGLILAGVGIAIALFASPADHKEAVVSRPFDLRAWSAIIGGAIAFIVFGRYGGLAVATFSIVFISALGDKKITFKQAFWLSLGMVVIAIVVFHWALQMRFPLFPWD